MIPVLDEMPSSPLLSPSEIIVTSHSPLPRESLLSLDEGGDEMGRMACKMAGEEGEEEGCDEMRRLG